MLTTLHSPLVSIITVCFNSKVTISNTIESVKSQDYENIEYIIIDGASTDGTLDVLKNFEDYIDYFSSEVDQGIYDAINKGLRVARGDIIAILNSDDKYAACDVISKVVDCFRERKTDSVLTNVAFVESSSVKRTKRKIKAAWFKPWRLRFGWMPPHPGMFLKKSVYQEYGNYSIRYEIAADYEFVVRAYLKGSASYYLSEDTTVHMSLGGASTKGLTSTIKISEEIVKSCRSNGVYTNLILVSLRLPIKLYLMLTNR